MHLKSKVKGWKVMSAKTNKTISKIRRGMAFIFLVVCMLLLASCGNTKKAGNTIYGEDGYNYSIVYSAEATNWDIEAIEYLAELLEKKCGVKPELICDMNLEASEENKEILIGVTNRAESALPELGANDSYWCVKKVNNKIVVNGSHEYVMSLAVDYFVSQWIEGDEGVLKVPEKLVKEETLKDFYRDSWSLTSIPAYQGGTSLDKAYDCGAMLLQSNKSDGDATTMQSIRSTNEAEVVAYAELLNDYGYTEESHTIIANNHFYRFTDGTKRVSVNYYVNDAKASVILSENTVGPKEVSYTYEPKGEEQSEFYIYGLRMNQLGYGTNEAGNTDGLSNVGQANVIKCADGSVIIIDGGTKGQQTGIDEGRFMDFLYEITGKEKGEVITVSAWYITHQHSDHVQGIQHVLSTYSSQINLERVITNLSTTEVADADMTAYAASEATIINSKWPECQDIKVHTGDVIQIADVTISVLNTHEEMVDETGTFYGTKGNGVSVVSMFRAASGMSMLITGDINVTEETVLCGNFGASGLKCDILQQPHHNMYNVSTLYECANAQVMLFTQSRGGLTRDTMYTSRSTLAQKWCSEWYCGGSETAGFAVKNGKVTRIYREDVQF